MYLVVFKLDDPKYKERLQYWLRVVAQYTKDRRRPTAVVVVATHADKMKGAQREAVWADVLSLLSAHRFVVATLRVSCITGEGVDQLRKSVLDAIGGAGLLDLQVPTSYVR